MGRRKPFATFETKPGEGSGAGYERWRSWEWRPHTARKSSEDVFVYHHRLLYLISDELADVPIAEALVALEGCDVHHENGVKWDNRLSNLELLEHGTHAEVTQSEMRAWGEDAKRQSAGDVELEYDEDELFEDDVDRCDQCGDETDILATAESIDGEVCIECATRLETDGEPIEVL